MLNGDWTCQFLNLVVLFFFFFFSGNRLLLDHPLRRAKKLSAPDIFLYLPISLDHQVEKRVLFNVYSLFSKNDLI